MNTIKKLNSKLLLFIAFNFLLFAAFACSENSEPMPEQTTYMVTLVSGDNGIAKSDKTIYLAGESVSVTAIPNEGFSFSAWHEGENQVSNASTYTFSMPERDLTLWAIFTPSGTEPATEGTIDMSKTINSAILGGAQRYTIYLPPSYNINPEQKYPILYLLHGLGQNYTSWTNDGNMKAIADNAIATGICKEMIIVCPEAYATFYVNGYYQGMDYEDYFINEFIPAIESTYRINASKSGRSISGLSMGGYGSTYHAFKRPEMFSSCFAMSSAYTGTYTQVSTLVVGKTAAELAEFPAFVMECGTEDFAALPMNNNVNSILSQTSLVYTYTTRSGRHDWAFWQECLPKALKLANDNFK